MSLGGDGESLGPASFAGREVKGHVRRNHQSDDVSSVSWQSGVTY